MSVSRVTISPGFAYGLSARTANMRTLSTLLAGSKPVLPHARSAPTTASAEIAITIEALIARALMNERFMSELSSKADARQERNARCVRAQRVVVVVADALD